MCTTDCRCYSGATGETKARWESLGEEKYNKFNRTSLSKTKVVNGTDYYPLKWTSNPNIAKHTFKECYESIFKRADHIKYGPMLKPDATQFYDKKEGAK